jgi:UDP-N-acetylglucosamine 2-epimerase (non-hydrolysing)
MRIMTVVGTRPEIIRLSRIVPLLDAHSEHVLVHTGQNSSVRLSQVFFEELGVRRPDVQFDSGQASFGVQVGRLLEQMANLFEQQRPDRLLILGDTNSGLSAIVAARVGIPVFHMEAGNRCYDDRVPEEINRRLIDHASTILLPYTHRSKENLLREGIERERIFVTGNPIGEVMTHYEPAISRRDSLSAFQVSEGNFFLLTLHRAENVDDPSRLERLLAAVTAVGRQYGCPVLFSVHPRTADRIRMASLSLDPHWVRPLEPLGFLDFMRLERDARAVLTDSGTVQEECAILGVPVITLRDVTERPETRETGANLLAGADHDEIARTMRLALASPIAVSPPEEYVRPQVSSVVARLLLGRLSIRRHS